jgi:hypothetical protein
LPVKRSDADGTCASGKCVLYSPETWHSTSGGMPCSRLLWRPCKIDLKYKLSRPPHRTRVDRTETPVEASASSKNNTLTSITCYRLIFHRTCAPVRQHLMAAPLRFVAAAGKVSATRSDPLTMRRNVKICFHESWYSELRDCVR